MSTTENLEQTEQNIGEGITSTKHSWREFFNRDKAKIADLGAGLERIEDRAHVSGMERQRQLYQDYPTWLVAAFTASCVIVAVGLVVFFVGSALSFFALGFGGSVTLLVGLTGLWLSLRHAERTRKRR